MFFAERWRNTPSPEMLWLTGSIGNRLILLLVTAEVALPTSVFGRLDSILYPRALVL